jgi:hypothetical protein
MRSTAEKPLAPKPAARHSTVTRCRERALDRGGRNAGPLSHEKRKPGNVISIREGDRRVVEQEVTVRHLLDHAGRVASEALNERLARGRRHGFPPPAYYA